MCFCFSARKNYSTGAAVPQTNTWSGGLRYLFSYPKYKARHVSATGILPGRYKYLFSYPKYEAYQVIETWLVVGTYFLTQNMKPGMYLRPARLQIPVF